MKFPIVIYPSEDTKGFVTAHCLNMDLVAEDSCVEGAVSQLLENMEAALAAAKKHNAHIFSSAPREYWDMLSSAKALPKELMERIAFNANTRNGLPVPFDVESQFDLRATDLVLQATSCE